MPVLAKKLEAGRQLVHTIRCAAIFDCIQAGCESLSSGAECGHCCCTLQTCRVMPGCSAFIQSQTVNGNQFPMAVRHNISKTDAFVTHCSPCQQLAEWVGSMLPLPCLRVEQPAELRAHKHFGVGAEHAVKGPQAVD